MPLSMDWAPVVSQGIFAVLFVYLFLDTRNESRKRETTMRDSFVQREAKFMDGQDRFLTGLHENTLAITKLNDTLESKLEEMKEHINRGRRAD